MNVAQKILLVIGLLLAGIGAAYILCPALMLSLTGAFQLDGNALADVRATYGGVQLGLGAFLVYESVTTQSLGTHLRMVVWAFACVGVVRLVGAFVDGQAPWLHAWVGMGEVLLAIGIARLGRTMR